MSIPITTASTAASPTTAIKMEPVVEFKYNTSFSSRPHFEGAEYNPTLARKMSQQTFQDRLQILNDTASIVPANMGLYALCGSFFIGWIVLLGVTASLRASVPGIIFGYFGFMVACIIVTVGFYSFKYSQMRKEIDQVLKDFNAIDRSSGMMWSAEERLIGWRVTKYNDGRKTTSAIKQLYVTLSVLVPVHSSNISMTPAELLALLSMFQQQQQGETTGLAGGMSPQAYQNV
jgi:hypothetical protein